MSSRSDSGSRGVRHALIAAALAWLLLLLLYHDTVNSMVAIWAGSDTFAHGFLILPISLWLIWMRRDYLWQLPARPAPWIALLLLPLGAGWLLAKLVDVLVVQQLALVSMLIVATWSICGHQLTRALTFPLAFLFFAVPMGASLIAPMMDFTAYSTVWMIRATGIAVFREGLYFSLPSGNWSVVEACSGVRYIIASLTVGTLFAYLNYVSWWRRALFILVAAIVPVFANTARAYLIVMLGHFSGMSLATGVDHLVYGWLFFGVVIFILFWIGSFFREEQAPPPVAPVATAAPAARYGTARALAVFAVLLAAALPALLLAQFPAREAGDHTALQLPAARSGWERASAEPWDWRVPSRVAGERHAYYRRDTATVGLTVQFDAGAADSGEVVGSSRLFATGDSAWQVPARARAQVVIDAGTVTVDEALVRGVDGEYLVWSWYQLGGLHTANDYVAKLQQAALRLGIGRGDSWRLLLVTPVRSGATGTADARALLQRFLDAHGATLTRRLQHGNGSGEQ